MQSTIVTYRILFLLLFAVVGCPDVSSGYLYAEPRFGKCYHFVDTERYWTEANTYCAGHQGHVVTVGSWAIQQYLVGKIQSIGFGKNGYWIGANDRNSEGAWRWDSGKVVM
ncbi:CLEC17A [Bugula neritina]|uniref:CLEC17A n=1 Tax=Bugula neritina TaxID=10212 RepID=A0A7J7JS82_BUGNE|nr:CLEC17A [Bugula neritina]